MLGHNFKVTSRESRNYALNTHVHILKCWKFAVPEVEVSEFAT